MPRYGGPKLPQDIVDRLEASHIQRNGQNGRGSRDRQEQRKRPTQQRNGPHQSSRVSQNIDDSARQRSRTFRNEDRPAPRKPQPPKQARVSDSNSAGQDSEHAASVLRPVPRPASGARRKLAEDDADVERFEKKLGIKGRKSLPKSFRDDGLEDLLAGLDSGMESEESTADSSKRKRRDGSTSLEVKRRRISGRKRELSGNIRASDESEESNSVIGDDGEGDDGTSGSESGSDEDILSESDSNDDNDESALDLAAASELAQGRPQVQKSKVRENPYVAPMLEQAKNSDKYVPPSLRKQNEESDSSPQLRRQLRGLLNRMAEANLISILRSIEDLYQSHPRATMSSTLLEILLDLVCDPAPLNDTFIILHAGFAAALYRAFGADLGAQMVERIVGQLGEYLKVTSNDSYTGKQPTNLMSFLVQLYNLDVIGPDIMFDYIRILLADLSETRTELLLRVVRLCGLKLRQDDPSSLVDIVSLLQKTMKHVGEASLSVRTKFMVEAINDLKNNRTKFTPGSAAEQLNSMKRTLGSLKTRSGATTEPLRLGLRDIQESDKKGKWWLIGASWQGHGRNEARNQPTSAAATNSAANDPDADEVEDDEVEDDEDAPLDLVHLAKSQGMNTDIRRAVFITLMSASDYTDAYTKLQKLNLKKAQELEIPRVLLQCVGTEVQHNPYYSLVAKKLCAEHKFRMAFQFALWDTFKQMGEQDDNLEQADSDESDEVQLSTTALFNQAKLFAHLVAHQSLSLTVLKKLDFLSMRPKTRLFVEVLLVSVFLEMRKKTKDYQKTALKMRLVFGAANDIPTLVTGLRYFLRRVVAKTDLAPSESDVEYISKCCKEAAKILGGSNGMRTEGASEA